MPRGEVRTPAFMPVGTGGTVKAMYMDQVRGVGSDIILGKPITSCSAPAQRGWRGSEGCTSSRAGRSDPDRFGGFQVMSLSKLRKLNEEGVTFRSHVDGSAHHMSPERSIEIQGLLDSDIQMQLDECVALPSTEDEIERAMELSLRWAERCRTAFGDQPGKAMFGASCRAGTSPPACAVRKVARRHGPQGLCRRRAGRRRAAAVMLDMLDVTCPALPAEKPRYLMGVGTPDDIVKSVARGIDMFDCVMPTRAGRHGLAFTRRGKVNLRNARHADDPRPLDEEAIVRPPATTAAPTFITS